TVVVGVDVDQKIVERAQRIYGAENLSFQSGDATQPLAFDTDSFDVVVSFETIEHIQEQDAFLSEIRRVLKPEGIFFVSTPDRCHIESQTTVNPFHARELSEEEFRTILAPHFAAVRLHYQRTFIGSVFSDADGRFNGDHAFYERDGFLDYHMTDRVRAPRYMLAVCGQTLPPLPSSMLHDGQIIGDLHARLAKQTES
ncbi:MAG: class I SAM-dependent methyltransferase, partial [Pseudomonadota bacterium]